MAIMPNCRRCHMPRMDCVCPHTFGVHHAQDQISRERDATELTPAIAAAHAAKHAPMTEQVRPGETGPAKKMDMGKPPITAGFFKYFARASIAVSYISEYGDRKYAQPGKPQYSPAWQEVPNGEQRYGDADGRHRVKAVVEGDYDSESDMAHLAHKAWNAMAELEIALKSGRVELRIGNQIVDGAPVPGTFKRVAL